MEAELDSQLFIEMKNISVARGDAVVLHDISLRVGQHEHLAILGPNGCGKSTLIQTLTCQRCPLVRENSFLQIFGRERWDLTELRRHLGAVATELPGERTPHTTGRDAVVSGFFSSSTLWPHFHVTEAMWLRADEILRLLEVEHLRNKPVGQMSVGEPLCIGQKFFCWMNRAMGWTLPPNGNCGTQCVDWRSRGLEFC